MIYWLEDGIVALLLIIYAKVNAHLTNLLWITFPFLPVCIHNMLELILHNDRPISEPTELAGKAVIIWKMSLRAVNTVLCYPGLDGHVYVQKKCFKPFISREYSYSCNYNQLLYCVECIQFRTLMKFMACDEDLRTHEGNRMKKVHFRIHTKPYW